MLVAALFACLWAAVPTSGQDSQERIHASVIFTHFGERTPLLAFETLELTPLGARQMFSAGAFFRSRYIASEPATEDDATADHPIEGLRTHRISNDELHVSSVNADYITGSALAFMQGLYPPLSDSSLDVILTSQPILANGSAIQAPLGGYQYPGLAVPSYSDPNSIWLAGDFGCDRYVRSGDEYLDSDEFSQTAAASRDLYEKVQTDWLRGSLSGDGFNYSNAHALYEFVRYEDTHNRTVHEQVPSSDLSQLRALASQREYALNGNVSASGHEEGDQIRTVAGKALATRVLSLLIDNIETKGSAQKMSLLFGNYRPLLAFFALARLPNVDSDFYGLPEPGSSMVFELFSVGNGSSDAYPDPSDLMVRFMFRNGTSEDDALNAYPLFNRGRSMTDLPWLDFRAEMANVMVPGVTEWCDLCESTRAFCVLYGTNSAFWDSMAEAHGDDSGKRRLDPAVAAAVGVVSTLGVIALAVAGCLILGLRLHRRPPKRRSELGGFKGAEKLASDPDLVSGKTPTQDGKGHERVGSWELTSGANGGAQAAGPSNAPAAKPGLDEDDDFSVNPFADPVKVEDRV